MVAEPYCSKGSDRDSFHSEIPHCSLIRPWECVVCHRQCNRLPGGAAVRCLSIDDLFEGYAVLYHDRSCSFELLSCCLLAGPLWGSSQAETGRF